MRIGDHLSFRHKVVILLILVIIGILTYAASEWYGSLKDDYIHRRTIKLREPLEQDSC